MEYMSKHIASTYQGSMNALTQEWVSCDIRVRTQRRGEPDALHAALTPETLP